MAAPGPEIGGTAGDPRFFERRGPFPIADVAAACGSEVPPTHPELTLTGVAPLQVAGPTDVSFLDNPRYATALDATRAGAVIVSAGMAARVPPTCAALICREPYLAWARAAALFHPVAPVRPGVHASAIAGADSVIDRTAEVGPYAVIGARASVGPRCRIGAHAVIGDGVVLGADCRVGVHASVSHALVGDRVYIYPGARVGQEGFGFAVTERGFVTVPQLGRVIIENDVEIGANSTIDRGSAHDTVIGGGSRLDNLVQIGHNVRLGRACVIVAQAGVSGSTVIEDFVMIGGQAGITGHLRVGRKARIGAQAGIMADVPAAAEVVGSPAMPIKEFFRQVATLRRLVASRSRNRTGDAGLP